MKNQQQGVIVDVNGKPFSERDREELLGKVEKLPAYKRIEDVKNALKESPIVFLKGATGSGKSTQIPKIILDYQDNTNIIITQPRVAAAKALSSRVSDEIICETGNQNYALGEGVGYKTGRGISSKYLSKLSYHTSMYELMRLTNSKVFPDFYMLDEIHTDDIGNMFLANITREALLSGKKNTKLILSSATMNTGKTLDYFKSVSRDIPVIDIEGRSYPIEETFGKANEFNKYFKERYDNGDHILIFEEGKREIKDTILDIQNIVGTNTTIFEFHSEISMEEQAQIINYQPKEGEQIIIVATNSAEESLTVPYLDAVIDRGQMKVSSIDYTGTERLDSMNTSKASYRQRSGRTGRTHPGKAIRVNDTKYEDLPDFNTPQIEISTLEREVLILLKQGVNLMDKLSEYSDSKEKFLMDNPDPKLVKLTYERLFIHGAIDENSNITELGEEILSYPLSFFNSRIFVESIKRGVSKDMIEIVAILENKGFLKPKGAWKETYENSKTKAFSDLFYYLKIFRDLTSYNLGEKTLNFFGSECDFGFEWRKEYEKGEKMLFELIDEEKLEDFGINKRSIERILETIKELENRVKSRGITLENTGSKDDKIISLLSGSLTNIYSYDKKEKAFTHFLPSSSRKNPHRFIASNNSIIPTDSRKNQFYIGNPFIIGETKDKPEIKLLQNLTPIQDYHLEQFNNEIYGKVPKFDLLLEDDLSKAKRGYLKALKKVEENDFIAIDENTKKQEIFDEFYEHVKYSDPYIALIIFLKDLKPKVKKEKAELFSKIKHKNKEYFRIRKDNAWLKSLLENLENIERGENFSMDGINYGFADISKVFLNDPIFREQNIQIYIQTLKNIFIEIKKITSSYIFEDDNIFDSRFILSFNKIFSNDKRRKKSGINGIKSYLTKITNLIERLENDKTGNKNKDRNLTKKIKRLKDLQENIKEFIININSFSNLVSTINFDNILYSHTNNRSSNDRNSRIFTEKYLYNISRKIVLEDQFISDHSSEEKNFEKLKKYLSSFLGDKEIKDLSNALSLLYAGNINEKTRNRCLEIISKYKNKLTKNYKDNCEYNEETKKDLNNLKEGYFSETYTSLKNLLLELFEEDYVEQIKGRIFEFTGKFHNCTVQTFDKKFKDFICSLDFTKILEEGEFFNSLEKYNYYISDYFSDYQRKRIRPQVREGEIGILDIQKETVNILDVYEKMKDLQAKLQK